MTLVCGNPELLIWASKRSKSAVTFVPVDRFSNIVERETHLWSLFVKTHSTITTAPYADSANRANHPSGPDPHLNRLRGRAPIMSKNKAKTRRCLFKAFFGWSPVAGTGVATLAGKPGKTEAALKDGLVTFSTHG